MTCPVAVYPHPRIRGVKPPGAEGATHDWRRPRGTAENTAKVWAAGVVSDLEKALLYRYDTDAHLVSYVMYKDGQPLASQPRITKGSLQWLREQGYEILHGFFAADVDNPGHEPWNEEFTAEFELLQRSAKSLQTAILYTTAKGWRIIQMLLNPLKPEQYEPTIAEWVKTLERDGIAVDRSCLDYTRMFRMPYVRRDGYQTPTENVVRL